MLLVLLGVLLMHITILILLIVSTAASVSSASSLLFRLNPDSSCMHVVLAYNRVVVSSRPGL